MRRVMWIALGATVWLSGCERAPEPPSARDTTQASPVTTAAAAATTPTPATTPEPAGERVRALAEATPEQLTLLEQAKVRFLAGDDAGAAPLFERLASSRPISSPVVTAVVALGASEAPLDALARYASVMPQAEGVPEVHLMMARAYAQQSKFALAASSYERVLRLDPSQLLAHVELGQMRERAGDLEGAARAFLDYERAVYSQAKRLEDAATPPDERLALIDALSLLEDDRVAQALVAAAQRDPDVTVRARAARALGEARVVSSRELLQALAQDEAPQVAQAAREALAAMAAISAPGEGDAIAPGRAVAQ